MSFEDKIKTRSDLHRHIQNCFDVMTTTMIRISKNDYGNTKKLYENQKRNIKKFILDVKNMYEFDIRVQDDIIYYYDLYDDKEIINSLRKMCIV